MKKNRIERPEVLAIKEIDKLNGRAKENAINAALYGIGTGICLTATILFFVEGINCIVKDEYIGKLLGRYGLALLSASGTLFTGLKTCKILNSINNQIDIYSDMAKDQFVKKLEK